ncbi:MAG: succinate dehydrogenase cytochrome b subunit [Candidatus Eisenbacteria bacterium]
MTGPRAFFTSTIGQKVVMAVTGLVLVGFVFVHLAGNLLLYQGPEAINAYGRELRELLHGSAIWIARATLLAAVVLHVWSATALTLKNRAARPVGYRQWQAKDSTYASRTMRWSGVIVLAFVVYHLLHFTFGSVHPDFIEGDVYHNVVTGFQAWPASLFYIVAMVLLGFHLNHGVWSMFHTLGVSHPRYRAMARAFAAVFALGIVLGNISFPLAVLFGLVR